jgi:hypothetical protein
LPELALEFFLAACQPAEVTLSGFQFLAQGLQFLLALGDLLLEIFQGDGRHDGFSSRTPKAMRTLLHLK